MAKEESQGVWLEYKNELPTPDLLKIIRSQADKNRWFLMGVLGVSTIEITSTIDVDVKRYSCFDTRKKVVASVDIPDALPLEHKVAVLRAAIRMQPHGHDIKI